MTSDTPPWPMSVSGPSVPTIVAGLPKHVGTAASAADVINDADAAAAANPRATDAAKRERVLKRHAINVTPRELPAAPCSQPTVSSSRCECSGTMVLLPRRDRFSLASCQDLLGVIRVRGPGATRA